MVAAAIAIAFVLPEAEAKASSSTWPPFATVVQRAFLAHPVPTATLFWVLSTSWKRQISL